MSKIEVLRVPDERIPKTAESWPDGSVVLLDRDGLITGWVLADDKPALLAALLEDAGARQMIQGWAKVPPKNEATCWLFPVPEGE